MPPVDEVVALLKQQIAALEAIAAQLDKIMPYLAALADPKE